MDNRQQLILWGWVGIIPLFLPMMLSFLDGLLPDWLVQVSKWVPSSALMRVIRSSMVGNPSAEYYLPQLAVLVLSVIVVLAVDVWLVRRSDR